MFLSLLEVQHCTCVTVVLHTFVMLYVCTMWHMGCLWRSCVSRHVYIYKYCDSCFCTGFAEIRNPSTGLFKFHTQLLMYV